MLPLFQRYNMPSSCGIHVLNHGNFTMFSLGPEEKFHISWCSSTVWHNYYSPGPMNFLKDTFLGKESTPMPWKLEKSMATISVRN